ncbi:MAG: hypothetical protein R2857_14900 [Vampirovibrionales bacterium]
MTSFSSVVNQLIFAQAASVAIMANTAVVRAAYESSDEVQRIVSRAQSTHPVPAAVRLGTLSV